MTIKLAGRKKGMTRIFTKDGESVPVTVVEVLENNIVQIKKKSTDGYNALQLTTGKKKTSKLNKPEIGHFAKAKVEAGNVLFETKIRDDKKIEEYQIGNSFNISYFKDIKVVDVRSKSKGKGFAGAVKRWNFKTQDATHGNSLSHRAPGSIGQNQSPGKVFKGKKMAGHLGDEFVTVQSLKVVDIREDKNILLIKGALPGAIGTSVFIKPSVKNKASNSQGG